MLMLAVPANGAVTNTAAEMALKNQWVKRNLLNPSSNLPFSFNFNGQASSSSNLFSGWVSSRVDSALDSTRTQHTFLWTNRSNGLRVKCVAVEYSDFPVVEWTVYLTNAGLTNTPMLESIQGLDLTLSAIGE